MTLLDDLAKVAVEERPAAQQKPDELARFGLWVISKRYWDILEIGTHSGGTAWFLSVIGANVTAIDLDLSHAIKATGVTFVQADSREYVPPSTYDLVFIDGDHSYNAVKLDWERFRRFVRPHGAVAFHDIVQHPPEVPCDVHRLWQEIKPDYPTIEFISNHDDKPWAGIGVVLL